MNKITNIYVGVDVSKDTLDIALHPINQHFKVSNDQEGILELIKKLQRYNVIRIACESSGGYQRLMIQILRKAEYKVELLDPKLVKHFILSKKIKAKTDKIDAYMIALFTANNEPTYVQFVFSEKHEELRDLVRRRLAIIDDIAREKKRIKQSIHQKAKDFALRHICYLEDELERITNDLTDLINSDEIWRNKIKVLTSIPGIGTVSATTLIAEMPELGHIEHKKIASLMGVAPHTKQSGIYVGNAIIRGGRFVPRKAVYMAALTASHSKCPFKEFYQRLKSKGKKSKVCLVALMNKIITVANALLRKNEMWNKNACFI